MTAPRNMGEGRTPQANADRGAAVADPGRLGDLATCFKPFGVAAEAQEQADEAVVSEMGVDDTESCG